VGRRELLLVFLVGCNSDFDGAREEGRYAAADAPDAKIDRGFPEPIPNAQADATPDAEVDGGVDSAKFDAGSCVRDQSRDHECDLDASEQRGFACPANAAGNPSAPPPAVECVYTGWADAGTVTMCCK
jgi:hypothetical protein